MAERSAMVARVSSTSRQPGRAILGRLAFRVRPFTCLATAEVVELDGGVIGASLVADGAMLDHDLVRRVCAALRARASLRSRWWDSAAS